jgi:hypothetical protein
MLNLKIALCLEGDNIHITPTNNFPVNLLGNRIESYTKSFWEVQIIFHDSNNQALSLNVLSILPNGQIPFEAQGKDTYYQGILNKIKTISFKNQPTKVVFEGASFKKIAKNTEKSPLSKMEVENPNNEQFFLKKENQNLLQAKEIKNLNPEKITKTLEVPFNIITFFDGYVQFKAKLNNARSSCYVQIKNEYIKEEFDTIKNYISNYLKTKEIRAKVKFEYFNKKLKVLSANSIEIENITPQLIEEIKLNLIRGALKKNRISLKKDIYNASELLSEALSNKKITADNNVITKQLIETEKFLHSNQLKFLSKKHCSETMYLRFIPNPHFAFLFLLENNKNCFFIFETVDAQLATYIWVSKKSKKALMAKLEEVKKCIAIIKRNNRQEYKKTNPNDFFCIHHDYKSSNTFNTWKERLDEIILE